MAVELLSNHNTGVREQAPFSEEKEPVTERPFGRDSIFSRSNAGNAALDVHVRTHIGKQRHKT